MYHINALMQRKRVPLVMNIRQFIKIIIKKKLYIKSYLLLNKKRLVLFLFFL